MKSNEVKLDVLGETGVAIVSQSIEYIQVHLH